MEDDEKQPGQVAIENALCQLQNVVATNYDDEVGLPYDELRNLRYNLLGPYTVLNPLILNNLKINGKGVYALLDSGCTISSMSKGTMEKCGLGPLLQTYRTRRPEVVGVGGEMTVIGKIHLVPATMNRLKFVFPCQIVQGLVTPLLLGIDFMSMYCTRVNLYNPAESLDRTIISSDAMKDAYSQVIKDTKSLAM